MKEFIDISSRNNQIIKLVNSLKSSKHDRKKSGLFVLEGFRICKDAFENNIAFKNLLVTKSAFERYSEDISNFAEISENCYILSDEVYKKISDTVSPQGITVIGKIPNEDRFKVTNGKFIALENIQDPSNLGAISRTAEALGISGIIMDNKCSDPYGQKALRASMGTLLRMPVFFTDNILEFCKANLLSTVACVVQNDAQDIRNFNFPENAVCLIGNEGNGLLKETVENCDSKVTISMIGSAESLNASVAAAIAIWEMTK